MIAQTAGSSARAEIDPAERCPTRLRGSSARAEIDPLHAPAARARFLRPRGDRPTTMTASVSGVPGSSARAEIDPIERRSDDANRRGSSARAEIDPLRQLCDRIDWLGSSARAEIDPSTIRRVARSHRVPPPARRSTLMHSAVRLDAVPPPARRSTLDSRWTAGDHWVPPPARRSTRSPRTLAHRVPPPARRSTRSITPPHRATRFLRPRGDRPQDAWKRSPTPPCVGFPTRRFLLVSALRSSMPVTL